MNIDTTQQTEMAAMSRNCNHSAAVSRNVHIIPCSSQLAAATLGEYNWPNYKKVVMKYKECLKNHAATIGGLATDGCGEFMPGGDEGTLEALKCSACNCHRNFHRKEIDQSDSTNNSLGNFSHFNPPNFLNVKKPIWGGHQNFNNNNNIHVTSSSSQLAYPASTNSTFVVSYKSGLVPNLEAHHHDYDQIKEDDETYGGNFHVMGSSRQLQVHEKVRKRFRTKFTHEQKEKLLSFAEKAGWKIQKLDESVVQQFCQEIGIKRRVLKVWMHNNKQNYANKKNLTPSTSTALPPHHDDDHSP